MDKIFCYCIVLYLSLYLSQDVLGKKHGGRLSKASDDGKIVGGYSTTIQMYPYQAYLLLKKGNTYYQCGGSIISKRYILTAAHCLTGITETTVRIGSTQSNSGGKTYMSERMISHPQYNARTSDYDFGLIKVRSDMTIDGTNTKIAKLTSMGTSVNPGTVVVISGWGTTSENGRTSTNLMAVKVPVVSTQTCRQSYGNTITDRMFCAGVPEGGKDSCQGDSGGPAVNDQNGMQVGVVSFGVGCARQDYPGVYSNVSSVRAWIRTVSGV